MLDKRAIRHVVQNYTEKVKQILAPKSVVLFGSFVNGDFNEDSDIDIAVVFNDFKGNWLETAVLLQRLRRDVDDAIPYGIEPHLMDETKDPSGFLEHIMKTGEIIYEAT